MSLLRKLDAQPQEGYGQDRDEDCILQKDPGGSRGNEEAAKTKKNIAERDLAAKLVSDIYDVKSVVNEPEDATES